MSEPQAFERAIFENPDDATTYAAYADWLQDRDDPRGEFIAVQLALEDEARPKTERDALKAREAELLAAHEREWLGELAPHLLGGEEGDTQPTVEYWWARGFLTEMKTPFLTIPLAQSLAVAPAARSLRKLHIEGPPPAYTRQSLALARPHLPTPAGALQYETYFELIGAPCLENLRVFQMGETGGDFDDGWARGCVSAPGLEHVIACMPRIEELQLLCYGYDAGAVFALPNLAHLQVLRLVGLGTVHTDDPAIPLTALARNATLNQLTHLLIHPQYTEEHEFLPLAQVRELVNAPHLKSLTHLQLRLSNMGDDGARAIVESGILKRLGWLDLRNGSITDDGARVFADCVATKSLRRLDLSRNAVTSTGLNRLRRAGVNAVANNSLTRREQDSIDAARREADME